MNDKEIEEIAKRALLTGEAHYQIKMVDPYELSWWQRNGDLVIGMVVSFGSAAVGFVLGRLTS